MLFLVTIAAVLSTFLGGLFAFKFRDKLHLVLGFSAGAVIGVAFFDLLPEALELSSGKYEIGFVTTVVAGGFILYMILDRLISLHSHHEDHCGNENHRGVLGAGSLSIHSFLDGLAIGLSFKVSVSVGVVVALAVLAHDFSDGINTIGLILKNGGSKKKAFLWLAVDALAPVFGVITSLLLSIEQESLGLILAIFCGFFFYIGASDLLPESHHNHPTHWTTLLSILGIVFIYAVIHFAAF